MKWYHALILGLQVASLVTTTRGGLVSLLIVFFIAFVVAFYVYVMTKGPRADCGKDGK